MNTRVIEIEYINEPKTVYRILAKPSKQADKCMAALLGMYDPFQFRTAKAKA